MRPFKPSKLHDFLKNYFFKNKEEVAQLETSDRLKYRISEQNKFVDFIKGH